MKVWIDQDLCTGDGLCEEIAPDVFTLLDDGLAYVVEGDKIFAKAKGNPEGAEGLAEFPDSQLDAVVESAENVPASASTSNPDARAPMTGAHRFETTPAVRSRGRSGFRNRSGGSGISSSGEFAGCIAWRAE